MSSPSEEQAVRPRQHGLTHLLTITRTLAWSEFKLRYAGSALGYLWSFAKPMMLFGVLYVVFHKMLRLGEGVPRFPELLLLGIVLWSFFAETTTGCVSVLVQRADMLRKVSFPAVALPIAVATTSVMVLLFNLATVIALLLVSGITPTLSWLWFPVLGIQFYFFTMGLGLILSSLYVTMRDVGQLWDVLAQLLFYATPIIYPLSLVQGFDFPGTSVSMIRLVMSSPVAQIIEQSRRILVLGESGSLGDVLPGVWIAVPYAITILVVGIGVLSFQRATRRMVEQL